MIKSKLESRLQLLNDYHNNQNQFQNLQDNTLELTFKFLLDIFKPFIKQQIHSIIIIAFVRQDFVRDFLSIYSMLYGSLSVMLHKATL